MKANGILKRFSAFLLTVSTTALTASAAQSSSAVHSGNHKQTTPAESNGAWLGVIATNSNAPADKIHRAAPDIRLTRVFRESPAYEAGLRAGDVIWKFDGARIHNTAQFAREIRDEKPGETVPVEIFHHGKREELRVKLSSHHIAAVPRSAESRSFVRG
jgi:S1-C subfamily serine protease